MRPVTPLALLTALCLGLIGLSASGCGSGAVSSGSAADAQSAYDRGIESFNRGGYSEALPLFTTALETPGLPADLIADATLKRAQCKAEGGDFEAALADIDKAEQGATELDKVYLARGLVFKKRGDQKAASAEFQKARKVNPQLRIP